MESLNNRKLNWSEIDKSNPFSTPDRYFDTVRIRVSDRIARPHSRVRLWQTVNPILRPVLVAAVVLLGCFLAFHPLSEQSSMSNQVASTGSQSEYVADRLLYMSDWEDAVSDERFLSEDDLTMTDEITEEEMMYYLLNGGVQWGDIIGMMYSEE